MFSYCVTKDNDNEKVYLVSYLEEEIDAYCKENDLQVLSKPKYVEPAMVSHHFLWVGKDQNNEKVYLVSYLEEEIDAYCRENDLEILSKPKYVEPAMVSHHFLWVGKDKKPPILEISRPYKY